MSVGQTAREAATADERRFRANLQGEIDSAFVYRAMAGAEENQQLASVYVRLAEVEERHLGFWEHQLRSIGADPGPRGPSWRARTMSFLARRFGPRFVLPTVATFEQVDQGDYDDQPETAGTGIRNQERSHARVLRYVAGGRVAAGCRGRDLGPAQRGATGHREETPSRGGARCQRWVDVESGTCDGRRRGAIQERGDPHHRPQRTPRRRFLHGHR